MAERTSHLLYGGPIFTLDPDQPRVEALAVAGGVIVAAGSLEEVSARSTAETERTDLQGRTVLPGLIDAHLHLEEYARSLDHVDCETPTKAECLQRVRDRAARTPPGDWVTGHGWNQNMWEGYGTAADLDAVAPDHPVFLSAKSLHAAWVNSSGLMLAGIAPMTPDPAGGRIQRDAKGQPTGILFESAMELVTSILPTAGVERVAGLLSRAQQSLWRMGLTAVHDFDGQRCLEALQLLHQRGALGMRVVKHLLVDDLDKSLEAGLRTGLGDPWLQIGHLKLFADGALGTRTAAMLEPYAGEPENLGLLLQQKEDLIGIGRRALAGGLGLAVHAIGDRANRVVLDAYHDLREWEYQQGLNPRRHRIEHVQLIDPEDIPRVAQLGLVASMQPIHATSDMPMADRYWGPRTRSAYAWRSIYDSGAVLAFGSDAPVESPNPFWGMHAAVTRRTREGAPGPDGWIAEQRVDFRKALAAYTYGPAFASRTEIAQGKLSPGSWADLIVLPQNPFVSPPDALADILPEAAMVGGIWRFRDF